MWKKIHSNRDPDDTLLSELRKEFDPYFRKAHRSSLDLLQSSPKLVFVLMVLFLVVSLALTFTLSRHPGPKKTPLPPVQNNFDQILRTGAQLKRTILLKQKVDSITAKEQLTKADSLALLQALDSLQPIHPILK